MRLIDEVRELLKTPVVIYKPGTIVSVGPSGPVYGDPVTCFSGLAAFYLMSAGEQLIYDRIGNDSTHKFIFDSAEIVSEITADAWAVVGGKEYTLYRGENDLMETEDDVAVFTGVRRAV